MYTSTYTYTEKREQVSFPISFTRTTWYEARIPTLVVSGQGHYYSSSSSCYYYDDDDDYYYCYQYYEPVLELLLLLLVLLLLLLQLPLSLPLPQPQTWRGNYFYV